MFSTVKDFSLLARQVNLTARDATDENAEPFLVDVYQVRLWKLIHSPDQADLDNIADALQVGIAERNATSQSFSFLC